MTALTEDQAWLNGRVFFSLTSPGITQTEVQAGVEVAAELGLGGVSVAPSQLSIAVAAAEDTELTVASVVGFPSGRHHSLVKAAEARLAVQQGAGEIWLAPDPAISEENTLLAEFVAVRESVPHPVQLAVLLELPARTVQQTLSVARTARLAGIDKLVTASGWWPEEAAQAVDARASISSVSMILPTTVLGIADLGGVLTQLEQGAERVAVTDPTWLLSQ
ncbi:2-deoxyribose-5-phosphate aldolase [Corynebacterium alimapuense]|uniref:2-deoxyribose-5-phosphate aldolase n=1 Tax=Corynebacterium alimapuense TaxID=1576874 RepID=A0A3M8K743_9CORY|nr:2-deoxyribose-5-phosphate aldolase [Corynebacterium alimapuense]RNE48976.1 2-deoxyribose-5-phosphate aldolase [Corynebacterium alimapuense]